MTNKGFTLIELLIVVAIIGILASIAYPSYQRYVIKSMRTDMMVELQNIAQKIETKKIEKRAYTNISQSDIMRSTTFPYDGTAKYNLSLSPVDGTGKLTSNNWVITATPIATGQMKNDGTLSFNVSGQKCRDSTCGEKDWNK